MAHAAAVVVVAEEVVALPLIGVRRFVRAGDAVVDAETLLALGATTTNVGVAAAAAGVEPGVVALAVERGGGCGVLAGIALAGVDVAADAVVAEGRARVSAVQVELAELRAVAEAGVAEGVVEGLVGRALHG